MSRRHTSWAVQRQRDLLQEQRLQERAHRAELVAAKAAERERLRVDKERAREYAASRQAQADDETAEVERSMAAIEHVLVDTLAHDSFMDFERLKQPLALPGFDPCALATPAPAPDPGTFKPPEPSGIRKFVPGRKEQYARDYEAGRVSYERAVQMWASNEQQRQAALAHAQAAHESAVVAARAAAAAQHAEVDRFRAAFEASDPPAMAQYFSLVLEASPYPDGFPTKLRVAFSPESRQLVVEVQLPTIDVVPEHKAYRYVKVRDEIEGVARPVAQRRSAYAQLVAQVALRTIYDIMRADRGEQCETVVLNAFVDTIDPSTGQPKSPYLVTLRVTRDAFLRLALSHVDPLACLKGLNAGVSRSPAELEPVRPVVDFSMVDPRFIEEVDVLSGLDQRPNLMELTPGEFENLITNLFARMGLETRLTQASRDGGVDCVAWDQRPIFGGKVVIQAKRYKHTVGVSAVRDLFGTVQNEGASKGILVTTSGYGKASFEFAQGKPLELLDGANLLYLLAEHADIQAKIEVPDTWVDPVPDAPEPEAH